jgi:integrase/recombinase XerD
MKNHIIRILFILTSNRLNKEAKSVIKCRITFLKKRKEFSTGLFINPSFWNSKQQQAEPPEPDVNYINTQLSLIRNNLNQAFLFLQV